MPALTGKSRQTPDKRQSIPSLDMPVPYEKGDKFLASHMVGPGSRAEKGWITLDCTSNTQKDIKGVYTNGQSDCASVAIIKMDPNDKVQQIYMTHLGGGMSLDNLPEMPENIDPRTDNVQVVVKLGATDGLYSSVDAIPELANQLGVNPRQQVQLYCSDPDSPDAGATTGLAITRTGAIGNAGPEGDGFKSVLDGSVPNGGTVKTKAPKKDILVESQRVTEVVNSQYPHSEPGGTAHSQIIQEGLVKPLVSAAKKPAETAYALREVLSSTDRDPSQLAKTVPKSAREQAVKATQMLDGMDQLRSKAIMRENLAQMGGPGLGQQAALDEQAPEPPPRPSRPSRGQAK